MGKDHYIMERRLALALSLCALLGASGALDCSVYEDAVGAQFRHASSRLVPCNAKSQGDSCTYMLNLTRPDGSLHTTDLAVDGCCVQDVSGQYFCSSERSRDASPTALTINKLLRISYQCQGGSVTVSKACDASFGFQTLCQQGAGSPDDNCRVCSVALACAVLYEMCLIDKKFAYNSVSTKGARRQRSYTTSHTKSCKTTSSADVSIQMLVPTVALCPGYVLQGAFAKQHPVSWTTR